MSRGKLRILLGAAPGAGKSFAMLGEGRRLRLEGADLVVGAVSVRGRAETRALLHGLELCPAPEIGPAEVMGLNVRAVLDRAPEVALVDDYAWAADAGGPRWQQIAILLEAGIDVISTLDIRSMESLTDAVQGITGVREAAAVPDAAVRVADQIELVDASPELLRQRLVEGKIYSTREETDAALAGDFRIGTLAALRELALLWLAERVDAGLSDYRVLKNIRDSWPAREKIVVGVSGKGQEQVLARRAARMLAAAAGGELHVVHVRNRMEESGPESGKDLEVLRKLTQDFGGVFHSIGGEDVATTLLDFARRTNATQIVLEASPHRGLLYPRRGAATMVMRNTGSVDVHVISHGPDPSDRSRRPRPRLGRSREIPAFVLAAGLPVPAGIGDGRRRRGAVG